MQELNSDELGRRLAAMRAYRRLEQTAVIEAAQGAGIRGLGQTRLSQIENGSAEPSPAALRWLCDFYGVDFWVLTDPSYQLFSEHRLAERVEQLAEAIAALKS